MPARRVGPGEWICAVATEPSRTETQQGGSPPVEGVATGTGSWAFIIAQKALILAWLALNLAAVVARWDPYPFVLLTHSSPSRPPTPPRSS